MNTYKVINIQKKYLKRGEKLWGRKPWGQTERYLLPFNLEAKNTFFKHEKKRNKHQQ